jgi:hypothetical protein
VSISAGRTGSGKLMIRSSPPRLSLPPSGRLSMPSGGNGSASSHGSARSGGPAHMAQIRTNLESAFEAARELSADNQFT